MSAITAPKSPAARLVESINHGEEMTYAGQLAYLGKLEEIRAELRTTLRLLVNAPDRVAAAGIAADIMAEFDAMLADQNDCLLILH